MRRVQACVKSDLCGGVIRDVINCRSACVCVCLGWREGALMQHSGRFQGNIQVLQSGFSSNIFSLQPGLFDLKVNLR